MMTEVSIVEAYDAHLLGSLVQEEDEDRDLQRALTAGRLAVIAARAPHSTAPEDVPLGPHGEPASLGHIEESALRLSALNLRLEQENDDLARQILRDKASLRAQLDLVESRVELLTQQLQLLGVRLKETEEEKRRADTETTQLKEVCRRELSSVERATVANHDAIATHKQMSSRLSAQLEELSEDGRRSMDLVRSRSQACARCSALLSGLLKQRQQQQQWQQLSVAQTSPSSDPAELHHETLEEEVVEEVEGDCSLEPLGESISAGSLNKEVEEVVVDKVVVEVVDKVVVEEEEMKEVEVEGDCSLEPLGESISAGSLNKEVDEVVVDKVVVDKVVVDKVVVDKVVVDKVVVDKVVEEEEDGDALRSRLGVVQRELAASKLRLVEAECTIQDLQHRLSVTRHELGAKRISRFFTRPQSSTT
ncbi:rab GTPase-activating protein 1-like [Lethenteron reissneri]|uniref:rab GTPase-activating protein 1-like n=1 Tax=Lethenteron reissneri TaxID=7753 RepID=UPI002AB62668|nr:rab GTPase-activating protein 1-like [Lethenteron reissneri]